MTRTNGEVYEVFYTKEDLFFCFVHTRHQATWSMQTSPSEAEAVRLDINKTFSETQCVFTLDINKTFSKTQYVLICGKRQAAVNDV